MDPSFDHHSEHEESRKRKAEQAARMLCCLLGLRNTLITLVLFSIFLNTFSSDTLLTNPANEHPAKAMRKDDIKQSPQQQQQQPPRVAPLPSNAEPPNKTLFIQNLPPDCTDTLYYFVPADNRNILRRFLRMATQSELAHSNFAMAGTSLLAVSRRRNTF